MSTATSSAWVEDTDTVPLAGAALAQELKATAADGLTVEALGGAGWSPGYSVTKPPVGPPCTVVTWANTPVTSLGSVTPPKVLPASRKPRAWPGVSGRPVIGVPSGLKPTGPPLAARVSTARTGLTNRRLPSVVGFVGAK